MQIKIKKIKQTFRVAYPQRWAMIILTVGLIFQIIFNVIIPTFAFFDATAKITDNIFQASSLDLSLTPTDLGLVSLNNNFVLNPAQAGDLDFQYQFKVETDNSAFCAGLVLIATSSDSIFYSQPLQNFTASSTVLSNPSNLWQFKIIDPQNNPAGQICNFKFIFQAWQTDQATYDPLAGFSDTETTTGSVASGTDSGGQECIQVVAPNGGEVWWVGRIHEIDWETNNPRGSNADLKIDIYYSNDSGHSWGLVKQAADNTSVYFWRVSLLLENNTYWVPSPTARIKLVARYSTGEICGQDISDEDYCPPIEYDLLTPEELAWLAEHGLVNELNSAPAVTPSNSAPVEFNDPPTSEPVINEVTDTPTTTPEEIIQPTLEPSSEPVIADPAINLTPLIEPIPTENLDTPDTGDTSTPVISEDSTEILTPNTPDAQAPVCLPTEDPAATPIIEEPQPTT